MVSRTTNGAADACDRRSRTYPLTLLPVRRADEAFPKTENIAIMTAEICAVQPSSGALYSRTRAPCPLHTPALTASHPSRAEQVTSKAQEHHPRHPDRKLRQALQPANGTTPPPPLPPCTRHARAKHVPSTSRATQTSTDNRQLISRLDLVARHKRQPQTTAAPLLFVQTAGPVTLPAPAQNHTGGAITLYVHFRLCRAVV